MEYELAKIHPSEWAMLQQQGEILAKSALIANIKNPAAAVVKVWFGRELGLSAQMAIQEIHLIEGRPSIGVNAMQALLARGGVTWTVNEGDGFCEVTFKRPGWEPMVSKYTIAEAQAAKLLSKANWVQNKAAMLYARAFSRGARRIGADLLNGGMYTPDEIRDGEAHEFDDTADVEAEPDKRDQIRNMLFDIVGHTPFQPMTAAINAALRRECKALTGYDRPADIPDDKLDEALANVNARRALSEPAEIVQ